MPEEIINQCNVYLASHYVDTEEMGKQKKCGPREGRETLEHKSEREEAEV